MTFPTSPSDGQEYVSEHGYVFEYSSSESRWKLKELSANRLHTKPCESPLAITDGHYYMWSQGQDMFVLNKPESFVTAIGSPLALGALGEETGCTDSTGQVWMWGRGDRGCLGDRNVASRSSPVSVWGDHSFTQVSSGEFYQLAVRDDGTTWAWGYGAYYHLGVGVSSGINVSTPASVVGNHVFIQVSAGSRQSAAVKADGSAWCWGDNTSGNCGQGSIYPNQISTPVSVIGGHSFVQISSGGNHVVALKENGEVWAWGANQQGEIGDGAGGSRTSPVQVLISDVVGVCTGFQFSRYLKSDGSAWGAGYNYRGMLGDGTITSRYSPVSMLGDHRFVQLQGGLYHSISLRSDGVAMCCGWNEYGQLGNGFGGNIVFNRSSPVSVLGGHIFRQVTCGDNHCAALDRYNGIWTWGRNNYGQLGNGERSFNQGRSSPVSVIRSFTF